MGFKNKNNQTEENIEEVSKDEAEKKEANENTESEEKNTETVESEILEKNDSEDEASKSVKEKKKKDKKKKKSKEKADAAEQDSERDTEQNSEEIKDKSRKKNKKRKKKKDRKPEEVNIVKELLSLIIYIGIVVLLCFIIINFVGCRSRVEGESMMPTLNNKDNLWVDKLSYTFGNPKRFDVIIFNYNEDTTYVKRIIGLPGETVRIDQDGKIYIDNKLLVENYGMEKITANNLGRASQPVLLGKDEYFVLGDNRNNSSDSRWADVGNVQREDIVGKVVLRIYPFKDFGFVK
ncbi:MAG: signal peptidase I [Lachnospiraceae bacterium]|nr:signal peptidase I [Lachnospiraceae bacterium]